MFFVYHFAIDSEPAICWNIWSLWEIVSYYAARLTCGNHITFDIGTKQIHPILLERPGVLRRNLLCNYDPSCNTIPTPSATAVVGNRIDSRTASDRKTTWEINPFWVPGSFSSRYSTDHFPLSLRCIVLRK